MKFYVVKKEGTLQPESPFFILHSSFFILHSSFFISEALKMGRDPNSLWYPAP